MFCCQPKCPKYEGFGSYAKSYVLCYTWFCRSLVIFSLKTVFLIKYTTVDSHESHKKLIIRTQDTTYSFPNLVWFKILHRVHSRPYHLSYFINFERFCVIVTHVLAFQYTLMQQNQLWIFSKCNFVGFQVYCSCQTQSDWTPQFVAVWSKTSCKIRADVWYIFITTKLQFCLSKFYCNSTSTEDC